MSRQVQQLILEVLKSRPPTRDVKSYLNTFGRRAKPVRPDFFSRSDPRPKPHSSPVPRAAPPVPGAPVSVRNAVDESEHAGNLTQDATIIADRVAEDHEVYSLAESHTALVKLQGPFTDRQLSSIAEGLAYLKQLGLICVVVLDHGGWQSLSRYNADGTQVEADANELAPWLGTPHDHDALAFGSEEAGQRNNMVKELWQVANAFTSAGVDPRPYGHAVMRIAPLADLPASLHDAEGGKRAEESRAPLAADCSLQSVFRSLDSGQTPILIPLALYDDRARTDRKEPSALRTVCVDADDVMVALAREMADAGERDAEACADGDVAVPGHATDLTPLRLMVISREGGIPSHARGGNPHLSVNLRSEYDAIRSSFVWNDTHPTALPNLDMIRDCLAYMPPTSSGVMVTHRSPRSLIANLITNKAAHSPSLPQRLLARRQDVRHTPTILRSGLPVRVLTDWADVDQDKLQALLEQSFRRSLNREAYFGRLAALLDFVIITGDYDGLAIVTKEHAPGEDPHKVEPIAYLDKFAVLPKLQGSGAVDFLWGALRDEVHGLGLLDALNNNGGKNGFGVGRDLVWKSRAANPVNRWYFERSNGFVRLPPSFAIRPGAPAPAASEWAMFWCDAEQRLAELAGRNVLTSASSLDEVRDLAKAHIAPPMTPLSSARMPSDTILPIVAREECGRLERWTKCLATIPSAWN